MVLLANQLLQVRPDLGTGALRLAEMDDEILDLPEGQAHQLGALDERQALEVVPGVEAIARGAAGSPGKKAAHLLETDGLDRAVREPRQLPDLHGHPFAAHPKPSP